MKTAKEKDVEGKVKEELREEKRPKMGKKEKIVEGIVSNGSC